tara:strand:- start:1103 stop:1969 length:867 start_codon:yes stop_codon:yes gene_type:complete
MNSLINGPDWYPKIPKITPPAKACDSHAHLYGPFSRFPIDPENGNGPDTTYEQYRNMLDILGVERAILVQARDYGTVDHVTIDAIERANGNIKGIAAMPREALEKNIDFLLSKDFCGIRLSSFSPGAVRLDELEKMAPLIKELGWTILLHLTTIEEILELAPRIRKISCNILFDHLARVRGDDSLDNRGFLTLINLLQETEHCWVKICSWYRLSASGYPYDDMKPFAQRLIKTRPDRLVWGSNWPHPNSTVEIPNDGILLNQFLDWTDNEETLKQILVKNPEKLFGFK